MKNSIKLSIKTTLVMSILLISFAPASADYTVGNDDLLDALDAAIKQVVDGDEYSTVYSTWFSGPSTLTDDSTGSTATDFPALDSIASGGTLDTILTSGTITFGSDTTYPPFESIDVNSSLAVGFSIDLGNALAAEISTFYDVSLEVVFETSDWTPIIPNLQAGEFDAILSSMTKTVERSQEIDFTRSYFRSVQGILGRTDSPAITNITSLNSDTAKVGYQSGTTSELYANENLPDAVKMGYDTIQLAYSALTNGDVDYVLGDNPVLAFHAKANAELNFEILDTFGDDELFGIGVRKNTGSTTDSNTPLPILVIFVSLIALPLFIILKRKINK